MGYLINQYENLVKQGKLILDPKQLQIIAHYEAFLEKYTPSKPKALQKFWKQTFRPAKQKGFYIYGEVGRGKTMMMDLLHNSLKTSSLRVHFHDFMRDIHKKIETKRNTYKDHSKKQPDIFQDIALELRKQTQILCFDEFTVTDIADAMILGRLFTKLFDLGIILFATSNVPPKDLYQNGLNRQLFLPFIETLSQNVTILNLNTDTDYRLIKPHNEPRYFYPLSIETKQIFDSLWKKKCLLTTKSLNQKEFININERQIILSTACPPYLRLSFQDFNQQNFSAQDFLALCHQYSCFFIDEVPKFHNDMRNSIKRFIIFIDVLYDNNSLFFMRADSKPTELYQTHGHFTENFEFQRTVSRLIEMQSEEYLQKYEKKYFP